MKTRSYGQELLKWLNAYQASINTAPNDTKTGVSSAKINLTYIMLSTNIILFFTVRNIESVPITSDLGNIKTEITDSINSHLKVFGEQK